MGNEQVFGQVSGDRRSETEVLRGRHRGMDRGRNEVGGRLMKDTRTRAQGDGETSAMGGGLILRDEFENNLCKTPLTNSIISLRTTVYLSSAKCSSHLQKYFSSFLPTL